MEGDGLKAGETLNGRRFAAVLCHGVLGYLDDPEPMIEHVPCRLGRVRRR